MNRTPSNSLLHSLKGKIWLATSCLALFICVFGLISYLIVSFLTDDPFYAVFIPFLFLAFTVTVFGWWLSNEVVSPIEKIALLAKSIERGAATSLPRTLGSSEADELLQTLHRNNNQLQKIVGLMDEVAAGNLSVALTPLQNSDRLTNSFQQLLAKVSESISAKQDLEKLQASVNRLAGEIDAVRDGNLTPEIASHLPDTGEISETLKYLIRHLKEITSQIKIETKQTKNISANFRNTISSVIERDETRVQQMHQASLVLKQIPNGVQKICEDLADSATAADRSIEKARQGERSAQMNASAVSRIRRQIQEAIKQIQNLGERSQEIDKLAKTIGDLAQRTNMIALNASLLTDDSGENSRRVAVIVEEIERLAERAAAVNNQISTFNKSIASEISQAEGVLRQSISEAANLSKFAIETGNSLGELEKYLSQFLNLQNKLSASSQEQSAETEKAFQTFVKSISETEAAIKNLKTLNINAAQISKSAENLYSVAADFINEEFSAQANAAELESGESLPILEPNFYA